MKATLVNVHTCELEEIDVTPRPSYTTFKRSATNFEQFAKARKFKMDSGLTLEEAQTECREFNNNRTQLEIENGTKMEFEKE
jgi:hypothetical protein